MSLRKPRALLGALVLLGIALPWLAPPGAHALESRIREDSYAVVDVPAVAGAESLWIDVEAPSLLASDVLLTVAGERKAMRQTPFGAGVIVEHSGDAVQLILGLTVEAEVDVAITVVDADGRVLLSDGDRLSLSPVGDTPSPEPTDSPDPTTPPEPTDPPDPTTPPEPTQSADPTVSPSPDPTEPGDDGDPSSPKSRPLRPGDGPRPGLPKTGAAPAEAPKGQAS